MYVSTHLLAKNVLLKARELQTPYDLLFCALQVIHSHKISEKPTENYLEIDGYISYELIKHTIQQLTEKAATKLMSKRSAIVQEGCKELELIDDNILNSSPFYQAYKHIIQSIVGKSPILYLHLKAVEMVAGLFYQLRSRYNSSSITEVVLNYCQEEMQYISAVLMTSEEMQRA